jgi:hypothetical protein
MLQPSSPLGVPAITPHLNAGDPTLPAFTADEARAYALDLQKQLDLSNNVTLMHPMWMWPITVASVQFMTTTQAEQLLGIALMLATDAPVCVVELHGGFQDRIADRADAPCHFEVLYEIFDARTGNFLTFFAPVSSMQLPSPPSGVPAITPHLDVSDQSLPTFTAEDALAYMASHPAFMLQSLAPVTVVSAQFMTDAEYSARFHSETGLAPNKLLCVIEVHGRFRPMSAPPGVKPGIYHVVEMVFNARTGNFLMASALGSSIEPGSI